MGVVFVAIGAFLIKMLGAVLFLIGFLLLFIIVMLCLFLFCPIRYRGEAEYDGNLMARGKVTWLFSLLSVSFSYQEGEADSKIRIFGIDLLKLLEKRQKRDADSEKQSSKTKKKNKESKNKKKQQKNQPDLQISQIEDLLSEDNISKDTAKDLSLQEKTVMPDLEVSEIREEEMDHMDLEADEEWKEKSKISIFFRRIRELPQLLWKKIKGIFQTLREIFTNIKSKAEWLSRMKEFWKSENTQGMVCILKDNVLHLLRKIKPKVLCGTVFFGTGDPCMTGRILGGAAILYAAYGKGIQVVPDFEEARFEGELYVKGRLSLITIVLIVVKIFISNEWKQFKYDFDQLKEAL